MENLTQRLETPPFVTPVHQLPGDAQMVPEETPLPVFTNNPVVQNIQEHRHALFYNNLSASASHGDVPWSNPVWQPTEPPQSAAVNVLRYGPGVPASTSPVSSGAPISIFSAPSTQSFQSSGYSLVQDPVRTYPPMQSSNQGYAPSATQPPGTRMMDQIYSQDISGPPHWGQWKTYDPGRLLEYLETRQAPSQDFSRPPHPGR